MSLTRLLTRRRSAPVAVALGAALALTACAGPSSPSATTSTTVTLRVAQTGKILTQILDFGKQTPKGYAIKWGTFETAPAQYQALDAGALDVGHSADLALLNNLADGGKIKVVAALQSPSSSFKLLVKPNSKFSSASDLRGKKIAVVKTAAPEAFLADVLNTVNLKLSDVSEVNLAPAQAAAAYEAGDVDAWVAWQPTAAGVITTGAARVLIDGTGIFSSRTYIVATDAALANKADSAAIGLYLKNLKAGVEYQRTHVADWTTYFKTAQGLTAAAAEQAAPELVQTITPVDQAALDSLASSEKTFAALSAMSGTVPASTTVVDNRFDDVLKG